MTIISLEGASAVGKTTTAEALCDEVNAYRIPEVNALFDTAKEDSTTWYFERQCDRWEIAIKRERDHDFVILDGDVLQPLWYNWIAHSLSNNRAGVEGFAPLDPVFESHLQFATPQSHYFEQFQTLSPEQVRFVRTQNIETNCTTIRTDLPTSNNCAGRYSEAVLGEMFGWAEKTNPT